MKLVFQEYVSCGWVPGYVVNEELQQNQLFYGICEILTFLRLLISVSHLIKAGQLVQKLSDRIV